MNCNEFESTLNELLDLRKDPSLDSHLRSHSSQCKECAQTLEYYSAFADLGNKVEIPASSIQSQKPLIYFAISAAAVLLFLLSPLANIGFQNGGNAVNIAKATPVAPVRADSDTANTDNRTARINSEFWQKRGLPKMNLIEQLAFSVPEPPNLEQVGQSINSVWKSIQEDDFLLPIIQQSALLWMQ